MNPDRDMTELTWFNARSELGLTLAALGPGQFVIVEYAGTGTEPEPYAQASVEPYGFHCEVVSERYLPAQQWPIDVKALSAAGWAAPDAVMDNWWHSADTAECAAELLLAGLRSGRCCPDPDDLTWSTGTFPTPPNGGGEPFGWPDQAQQWAA